MVWIPGGTFLQGAVPQDQMAMKHEKHNTLFQLMGFLWILLKLPMLNFQIY